MEQRFVIERRAKWKPAQSDAFDSEEFESDSVSSKGTTKTSNLKKAKGTQKKTIKAKIAKMITPDNKVENRIDERKKLIYQFIKDKGSAAGSSNSPSAEQ